MSGIKYDNEKPEMYLLPPLATLEVGKVLTIGAKKYSPDNWRRLEGLQERYTSAALRHLLASMSGEENDEETGMSHLAHAICCLLFKLEDELLTAQELEPNEKLLKAAREVPVVSPRGGKPMLEVDDILRKYFWQERGDAE